MSRDDSAPGPIVDGGKGQQLAPFNPDAGKDQFPPEPCESCGLTGKHRNGCPVSLAAQDATPTPHELDPAPDREQRDLSVSITKAANGSLRFFTLGDTIHKVCTATEAEKIISETFKRLDNQGDAVRRRRSE